MIQNKTNIASGKLTLTCQSVFWYVNKNKRHCNVAKNKSMFGYHNSKQFLFDKFILSGN